MDDSRTYPLTLPPLRLLTYDRALCTVVVRHVVLFRFILTIVECRRSRPRWRAFRSDGRTSNSESDQPQYQQHIMQRTHSHRQQRLGWM